LDFIVYDNASICINEVNVHFQQAIQYLVSHPRVRKPFVGIIGVSKGGELALLISSLCHQVTQLLVSSKSLD